MHKGLNKFPFNPLATAQTQQRPNLMDANGNCARS